MINKKYLFLAIIVLIAVSFMLTSCRPATYELTIVIGPVEEAGVVNLDPPGEDNMFEKGTEVTLSAQPSSGWEFKQWEVDGYIITTPTHTVTMNTDTTVKAVFETFQLTLSADPPSGGSITADPDNTNYEPGEEVTLTAVPEQGYDFVRWEGDLSGSVNPANVTMDESKEITAVFDTNSLTVNVLPTVDSDGNPATAGTITLDPEGGNYAYGESVDIEAVPGDKWAFNTFGGSSLGYLTNVVDNTAKITMNQDHTIDAMFEEQWELNITILSPDETGDPQCDVSLSTPDPANDTNASGYYAPGTIVTITTEPITDFSFTEWSGLNEDEITDVGNGVYEITMNEDKEITANFIEGYRLYVNSIPTDTGEIQLSAAPNDFNVYPSGSTVTLTPNVLDNDYSLAEFMGTHGSDVVWNETNQAWEIVMDEIKYVTARFKLIGSESVPVTITGSMWSERDNFATAVYDGKMWVIGGEPSKSDIWSTVDGENWVEEWTTAPFGVRYSTATVLFDNKLWVLGGNDGNRVNDVWSYDGTTWVEVKADNVGSDEFPARQSHQALVYDATDDGTDNPTMWVIGGLDSGGNNLNDVWSSPDGITWTEVVADGNAPWLQRRFHTAHVFNHDGNGDKMYIIAGRSTDVAPLDYEDDIWFSTDGANWSELQLTPQPGGNWHGRAWHRSIVYKDKLWIFGGAYNDNGWYHRNDVWFSYNGADWTEVHPQNDSDPNFWSPRSSHASVVFNNKIWVLGGTVSGVKQNDVWYMD